MFQHLINRSFANPWNSFKTKPKDMFYSELARLPIEYSNFLDGAQTCYSIFNRQFLPDFFGYKL